MKPLFDLGHTVITPAAQAALNFSDIIPALRRHVSGNWGDVSQEDAQQNQRALACGLRLFSVYMSNGGVTFWIITEADRSSTTVLLPEDY